MAYYNEEEKIFQRSISKFLEQQVLGNVDEWEENHHFPDEIFPKLGAQGFLGVLIDEEYGGAGGNLRLASAWCEEFGKTPSIGFTTAVNMHSLVILPAIQRYGSKQQKSRWLPGGVEGNIIGAYAFTEPDAGSDLTRIRTKAEKTADGWKLNGSKIFITNGARADFVIVLAKTDPDAGYNGYSSFIVDTSLPGFSVSRKLDKMGWHSSDTAELSFSEMHLPDEALLGKVGQGWYQSMSSLEWERIMLSLNSLAGARQCLKETVTYVNERSMFGQTLSSFDLTKEYLAEAWTDLNLCEASCHRSLNLLLKGKDCRTETSLTKLYVCERAIEISDRCLQLHGGYGYTTEFGPERWLRDLRLNTIGGGTSEIMARIAGKGLFSST